MMTIFDGLTKQHREVEKLFGILQNAIASAQLPLARVAFKLLANKVIAGLHAEHTMVYPQFAKHAWLVDEVAEAITKHGAIEQATNYARVGTVTDDQWCEAVARVGTLLADHADFEESTLFPLARQSLTTEQIYGLAVDYELTKLTSASIAGVSITYEPEPEPAIYCHVRPRAAERCGDVTV